jgi:hypothetical protein
VYVYIYMCELEERLLFMVGDKFAAAGTRWMWVQYSTVQYSTCRNYCSLGPSRLLLQ